MHVQKMESACILKRKTENETPNHHIWEFYFFKMVSRTWRYSPRYQFGKRKKRCFLKKRKEFLMVSVVLSNSKDCWRHLFFRNAIMLSIKSWRIFFHALRTAIYKTLAYNGCINLVAMRRLRSENIPHMFNQI